MHPKGWMAAPVQWIDQTMCKYLTSMESNLELNCDSKSTTTYFPSSFYHVKTSLRNNIHKIAKHD